MRKMIFYKNEPASVEAIKNFEEFSGLKLPLEYKEFLLKHNGGGPIDGYYYFDFQGERYSILGFYRLDEKNNENGMYIFNNLYNNSKHKLFSVARTDSGQTFFINCDEGVNYGKVYIYQEIEPDIIIEDKYNCCANNFFEFLDKLIYEEKIYDDIEVIARYGTIEDFFAKYSDINMRSSYGLSFLCLAIKWDNLTLMKEILKCNPNTEYALGMAIRSKSYDIMEILFSHGVSLDEKDHFGQLPEQYIKYDNQVAKEMMQKERLRRKNGQA